MNKTFEHYQLWRVVLAELENYGPVVEQVLPYKSATRVLLERLQEHKAPISPVTSTSSLSVILQNLRKAQKIVVDQNSRGGRFRAFSVPTYELPTPGPEQFEEMENTSELHQDEAYSRPDYRAIADSLLLAVAEVLAGNNHKDCVDRAKHEATEDMLKQACDERDSVRNLHSVVEEDRKGLEQLVVTLKQACEDQKVKIDNMQHRLNAQEDDIRKLVKQLEKERKKGVPLGIHSPAVHQVLDDLLRTMPGTSKGPD